MDTATRARELAHVFSLSTTTSHRRIIVNNAKADHDSHLLFALALAEFKPDSADYRCFKQLLTTAKTLEELLPDLKAALADASYALGQFMPTGNRCAREAQTKVDDMREALNHL